MLSLCAQRGNRRDEEASVWNPLGRLIGLLLDGVDEREDHSKAVLRRLNFRFCWARFGLTYRCCQSRLSLVELFRGTGKACLARGAKLLKKRLLSKQSLLGISDGRED